MCIHLSKSTYLETNEECRERGDDMQKMERKLKPEPIIVRHPKWNVVYRLIHSGIPT